MLALGLADNINSVLPGFTRNPYNLAYASRKAQHYEQAADAYRKALSFLAERARAQGKPPAKDVNTCLALAEVYIKLARATQAAGQADKVREATRQADTLLAELAGALQKPAAPAESKPAVSLPAKLIVSAPKSLLDQPGLSFAEFKKAASVQYLTFTTKEPTVQQKE